MKVVINKCCGGFDLSNDAVHRIVELLGEKYDKKKHFIPNEEQSWIGEKYHIERNDPILVQAVGELGIRANGKYSKLYIVEIPDDIEWVIEEHDGMERVRKMVDYYE